MQSLDKKPTPGASNIMDTGYKNNPRARSSPPRTPKSSTTTTTTTTATRVGKGPATAVAGRALKIRTGPRETFLDDITPIDAGRYNPPELMDGRDSHDLSLSPREVTRDSLVDHMLLSFDQLSFGQEGSPFGPPLQTHDETQLFPDTFGDEHHYSTLATSRNGRPPAHGHSYSSDFDGHDTATRPSSQLTRGRRSNSSSTFQTGLARLNSIRNDPNGSSTSTTTTTNTIQRPPPSQSRPLHSRSGKGSKGSSANSLDLGYAQVTSNQRWTHGIGGRSSSFDFGQDRQSILNRQIETAAPSFSGYDYDAAPTPTVPVGPRRQMPFSSNPIYNPEAMPAPPVPKTLERKRSTRSSKSAYKPSDSMNGLGLNYGQGGSESTRELPPLPAFVKEAAAPAPHIGYGKSKESGHGNQTAPPAKDRPGFFRRVFGSSRNNHIITVEPHSSSTSVETPERPGSKPQHIASQMKMQPPPPREAPAPPKEHPHVLTKRPSSFFRRRKKSVSEPEAPPPMPPPPSAAPPLPQPPPEREDLKFQALPSPVSSLRQVMNPYLKSPIKGPLGSSDGEENRIDDSLSSDADDLKGFSPGYVPNPNATIRAVKPGSRESGKPSTPGAMSDRSKPRLEVDSPRSRGRNASGTHPKHQPDGTFLQDSSDNDREGSEGPARVAPAAGKENLDKRVASPIPPASVARDRALVAEYERTYSKRSKSPAQAGIPIANDAIVSPVGSKTSLVRSTLPAKDEEWVMLTPTRPTSEKEDQVWLEPNSSEEDLAAPTSNLSLPLEGARKSVRTSGSTNTGYKSATSLVAATVDGEDEPKLSPPLITTTPAVNLPEQESPEQENVVVTTAPDPSEPTEGERERAKKVYDGNEDFIQKAKGAAWMGEEGIARQRTLTAYMELYDFANLNILAALRILCGRLILKGESQQVDRVLDGFAKRWCQCNPNHGFKTTDVVHTICYSILLLNTDLHLADIESKMTRSQFIKNTMPTILRVVADGAPDAFESNRPTILPPKSQDAELLSPVFMPSEEPLAREAEKPSWRSSMKPPVRTNSDGPPPTPLNYSTPVDDCGPLVKAPFHGTLRTWGVQVEVVLKDFYGSIRAERLPLFGATMEKPQMQQSSQNSLSVFANGVLRRTPSVLSKTPSEAMSSSRGRVNDTARLGTGKWSSKNRSRPRVYPSSVGMGSSRTSLDDQSSMWSPSVSSSTWSKYSFGGKTPTSMSVDSLGSSWAQGDYQQSIGFASALSQAIIREESTTQAASGAGQTQLVSSVGSAGSEDLRTAPLLEDESLGLAGAPWAKEGLLKHKHHLESVDKKAKDRTWYETFAVIEKGYMTLFSFSTKSMRNKSKSKAGGSGGVVGGGNWQDNAENLGSFLLRQTIASALPPPGYSKARPHVWALSLPTGAVHLFQVGTPEIVREFVSTANYWSARLSNHPLVGGISNVEYGWSDSIVNNPLVQAIHESASASGSATTTRPSTSGPRPSMQSSLRSSLDGVAGGALGGLGGSRGGRMPGDRVTIAEWTVPTQSMRSSSLVEREQLAALGAYVQGIEEELQRHNMLRGAMSLAFTPRHYNAQKAMANWEKKSSYLLREIVKFRTYIDCLQAAEVQRRRVYAERGVDVEKDESERERNEDEDEDEGDVTLRPE